MAGSAGNSAAAVLIFLFVTVNFLFPCNKWVPLDRRTISVVGAVLCYLSRTGIDLLHAVNFDVMILLSSIMTVNYLIIHLKETKELIARMQKLVHDDPIKGFWALAFAAYITSPFLTNDGVCLLFVEPILQTFERTPFELPSDEYDNTNHMRLRKADAIFFLLALACSANIGSALTYTGNPQNMIVSSDAIEVMPSYMFLIFMLPASVFSWIVTIKWIQRCWMWARQNKVTVDSVPSSPIMSGRLEAVHSPLRERDIDEGIELSNIDGDSARDGLHHVHSNGNGHGHDTDYSHSARSLAHSGSASVRQRRRSSAAEHQSTTWLLRTVYDYVQPFIEQTNQSHELVVSPRRKLALEKMKATKTEEFYVVSPFPYAVPLLLCGMIAMIFAGVLFISGTVCIFSVLMIVTVAVGNHYRGQQTWVPVGQPSSHVESDRAGSRVPDSIQSDADGNFGSALDSECGAPSNEYAHGRLSPMQEPALGLSEDLGPMTREDEIDNLNQFFGAVYGSIDYNVLLIFLGLFVVIDNLTYTGIPRSIWNGIVGKAPFKSFGSVLGICVFVVFASQLLGNVPVIQLAKPNVQDLDDNTKRLAWALLSFVSTVAGNLTLTGSAANIIVAETAARLDASMAIDFFRHFHVCFWVTMLSCVVGALLIVAMVEIEIATVG